MVNHISLVAAPKSHASPLLPHVGAETVVPAGGSALKKVRATSFQDARRINEV